MRVFKVIAGLELTEPQMRELLEKKFLPPMDGFRSRLGKDFTAGLEIKDTGKVAFAFTGESNDPDAESSFLFNVKRLISSGVKLHSFSNDIMKAAQDAAYGLYAGFLRIPTRWFFSATSGLILLLAAAMASQMARFLSQADLLPSLASPLWDSSWLIDNGSLTGRFLHTLIGYDAMPSGIQVVFYVATLILILIGMRLTRIQAPAALPARG